jgi:hypothetical protein
MSEFKGTKGEWLVSYEYDEMWEQETAQIGVKNENDCIITCWSNFIENEYKANALLISKAPEMLEMLDKISKFIDENKGVNYWCELLKREVPEIKQLIKEATTLCETK